MSRIKENSVLALGARYSDSASLLPKAPTVSAEGRVDFALQGRPDHEAQGFLDCLLLGPKSGQSLSFGHQLMVDFDAGAHGVAGCMPTHHIPMGDERR